MKLSDMLGKTYTDKEGIVHPSFTVLQHSVLVGVSSLALLKYYPEFSSLSAELSYFFSLHDVGKVSPGFQAMISCALNGGVSSFPEPGLRFDSISDKYCRHHEEGSDWHFSRGGGGSLVFSKKESREILRMHHGSIRCKCGTKVSDLMGTEAWEALRDDLTLELSKVFGSSLPDESFLKKNKKVLMGLLCISDWIGSDEGVFPPDPTDALYPFQEGWSVSDLVSRAEKALLEYGLVGHSLEAGKDFSRLFGGFTPRPLQKLLMDAVKGEGIYILEAPMGGGKTEASLYCAYDMITKGLATGFYFGLPTQVTSNKIHTRVEQALNSMGGGSASLIHGKAKIVYQSGLASRASSWFRNNKRAILSPYGVGTIDQALMGVLSAVKHYFLRVLGVHKKVLILDEVHSYDTYTSTLLQKLVKDGHIVIILSATLTAEAKADLLGVDISSTSSGSYPLVTSYVGGEVRELSLGVQSESDTGTDRYIVTEGDKDTLLSEALHRAKNGEKVLWFQNTVGEAQEIYDRIKREVPSGLLHSRFTSKDRESLEAKWLSLYGKGSTPQGLFLVSTQVAEQSLDIDADVMYTDLCPIDMLLQRMGRVWRHPRPRLTKYPEVKVFHGNPLSALGGDYNLHKFAEKAGKSAYVYHPWSLCSTLLTIRGHGSLFMVPKDIRKLLEVTYNRRDRRLVNVKSDMDKQKSAQATQAQGAQSQGSGSLSDDDTIPGTRLITDDTTEVLLCEGVRGTSEVLLEGTWVDLNDWRMTPVIEKYMIRVSYSKVQPSVRKLKKGKFDFLAIVVKDGYLLDSSSKRTNNTYDDTLGMRYN